MIGKKLKSLNAKFLPGKLVFDPEWLVLGVNNICNLHCKMCDVGLKNTETNFAVNLTGTKPLNMPLELFRRIVDQSTKYYPNVKLGYAFTEPLIYPFLIESLEYANEHGLFTSITTNALNLKQKAEQLVKAGLNEIYISLDGPEDVHNEIRGHKSSFQRAIEGIQKLLSFADAPKISVYCVITEWNIGRLVEFADFFKAYPIKELGFMHTNFTNNEMATRHNSLVGDKYPATYSCTEEIDLSKMNLDLLWDEIKLLKAEDYPFKISFSPELPNEDFLQSFYFSPETKIGKVCNDVFRNLMIKSDGSVIPAHGRCYNLNVGNIYNDDLNKIWNSQTLGEFRKDLIKAGGLFPACTRCCSAF